jgi:ATP-binding cassette subfamily D (ALD) long-chain fatty acid import protein
MMQTATLQRARAQAQANAVLLRSKLGPILATYVRHRASVQKGLTAGFVLYCLGTTYLSLTGKGKGAGRESSARRSRGKGACSHHYKRTLHANR